MAINDVITSIKSSFMDKFANFAPKILTVGIILLIAYFVIKIICKIVERFFDKVDFDRGVETFIENSIKVVLWLITFVIILSNLGVDVSGLLAGLGIMGFIVGFALKDTLGNLAAGIFILFHKPFRVKDWINVGGTIGSVEHIGIAATTLHSADNTKITIPNGKVWGDTILNYTGNNMRKLFNLEIGISYDSNIDKAMKIITEILKKDKRVLKEPKPQLIVKSLGDSSVNIGIRPACNKEDYWSLFFDLQKEIKEQFDKNNIVIPFPQRDVHMKK